MIKIFTVFGMMGLLVLTGCASSKYKARLDSREKQASSAGLYCEWIDGDKHSDIDVEVNLQMARRCDSSKPFSLTPYKNSSDANGILYCCATRESDSSKGQASSKRKSSTSAKASADAALSAPTKPAAKDSGLGADDEIVEDK